MDPTSKKSDPPFDPAHRFDPCPGCGECVVCGFCLPSCPVKMGHATAEDIDIPVALQEDDDNAPA